MILLNNISKKSKNGELLFDVSLELEGNGVFGIVIPNDEEREGLVKILTGNDFSFDGEIALNDETFSSDGGEASLVKYKKKIGYFAKKPRFYGNMTAKEIMEFVGATKGITDELLYRQIKEALELTGIDRIKDILCDRFDGAEERKLSLASAFLGNPDLIIAQEPYASFNEREREEIRNILRMVGNVKPVIVVLSSSDETEELCDKVFVISEEGEDESDV